jgi:serine/threonine protein kinase
VTENTIPAKPSVLPWLCLHAGLPGNRARRPPRSCSYKVLKQLGDGTYGSVWKAVNRQTNEVVRRRCQRSGREVDAPPLRFTAAYAVW